MYLKDDQDVSVYHEDGWEAHLCVNGNQRRWSVEWLRYG